MLSITLEKLLDGVPCSDFNAGIQVQGIYLDSRQVQDGSAFIAVAGDKLHGKKFIANAIENGASVLLVDGEELSQESDEHLHVVYVNNLKSEVSKIASNYYAAPSEKCAVVGVTGTNGKSTIVFLVAQLAEYLQQKAGTVGTLGYGLLNKPLTETGLTTPDAISCQKILSELYGNGAQTIAMEVSSHGIDQGRVAAVKFAVAVLSNITRDHLDYHGSFEAYAKTKASFVESQNSRAALINIDDPEGKKIADALTSLGKNVLTYSIKNSQADVFASRVEYTPTGFNADIHSPWGNESIQCQLLGEFNLSNVLASLSAVCVLGSDFQKACNACGNLKPVAGRMQKVEVASAEEQTPLILIDYAHTPDALHNALAAAKKHTKSKLWVVFGCGGDRDKGKRPQMAAVAEALADQVVVTSDNPRTEDAHAIVRDIEAGFAEKSLKEKNICSIEDREQAIHYAIENSDAMDCIVVAGKGHEKYQIIGETKMDFDDYLVAKQALQAKLARTMASTDANTDTRGQL